MNHIPVEVLREIFTKLDLKDKIECMLVCRSWYDTLDRFTLLCSLSIHCEVFDKIKDMLSRFPHRAIQVGYMNLTGYESPDFDKSEFCNMFPNLRELGFNLDESYKSRNDTSTPFQFLHSTCKLEKIRDSTDCGLAPQLAMSNLCNKLKILELNFRVAHGPGAISSVVSQLKNMPVLEDISMAYINFKLTDLEMMRSNLPSLKRLCLEHAYPISGEIPRDVVPASLITEMKVRIVRAEDRDAHIQFYNYIGNKYSSLKNPILYDDMEIHTHDEDVVRRIYNEGIFPLYQKIGSQVDTF